MTVVKTVLTPLGWLLQHQVGASPKTKAELLTTSSSHKICYDYLCSPGEVAEWSKAADC